MERNKLNGRFMKGYTYRSIKPFWNKKWLFNEYITLNKSSSQIAIEQNCKPNNILYWLNKHKIKIRNISETRKIKHWGQSGEDNPMFNKKGELNPNWKGGITKERQSFYQSIEWKNACSKVWKRDKSICQRCHIKRDSGITFHIHHKVSFKNKELRADINNLILLCELCHNFVHSKKNKNQVFLEEVMKC